MVMEVVEEDMYEGGMQYCLKHPFKNNSSQGGICAFCLQEKLGNLVSSSFPVAIFPSSSSSSSSPNSFRSNNIVPNNTCSSTTNIHAKRAKLPFLLTQKKKKQREAMMMAAADAHARSSGNINLKRSNSIALMEEEYYSPHRKGFWSFLYLSHPNPTSKKTEKTEVIRPHTVDMSVLGTTRERKSGRRDQLELVVVEENDDDDDLERKVSRSRSVGCGSRSFSGDFLERISTGFGDCSTLRRVESQREGKSRIHHSKGGQHHCIKERVRCRGIFSGFIITSSSSSSSSSYTVSTSKIEQNFNGKPTTSTPARASHHHHHLVHARSKSWGWAFASPMRAFSGKKDSSSSLSSIKNATTSSTPNLAAIPSLLAARG